MAHRPFLVAACLLFATPATAQINQPSPDADVRYAGEQPLRGPRIGGLPKQDWLTECARRLNNHPGMATAETTSTCESWWGFYQAGGAPHPTYGYVVPVNVSKTTAQCPEQVVETRVIRRKTIKRRVFHVKRVRI